MSRQRTHSRRALSPEDARREIDEILSEPTAAELRTQNQTARILAGPPEAKAAVPVKLASNYYWSPFSLWSGLAAAALPLVTPPCWKILTAIAIRQMHAGLPTQNATVSVAISIGD